MKKEEKHLTRYKTTSFVIPTGIWTPQADKWSGGISYETSNMRFLRSLGRLSRLRRPSIGRHDRNPFRLRSRLKLTIQNSQLANPK
jgi:hypothetical protein